MEATPANKKRNASYPGTSGGDEVGVIRFRINN